MSRTKVEVSPTAVLKRQGRRPIKQRDVYNNQDAEEHAQSSPALESSVNIRSPITPVLNLVSQMRRRLEGQLQFSGNSCTGNSTVHTPSSCNPSRPATPHVSHGSGSSYLRNGIKVLPDSAPNSSKIPFTPDDATSPILARLRYTPGRCLKEKQQILIDKHNKVNERAGDLLAGGGVSMWPEMTNMRLSSNDSLSLIIICVTLIAGSATLFKLIHGDLCSDLADFHSMLSGFHETHSLVMSKGNASFTASVLAWHTGFNELMEDVQCRFTVSLAAASLSYQMCVILYCAGIGVLLYFLTDSILAQSKLTPRRIKTWTCLLAVLGTWTLLGLQLLVLARATETAVETAVHKLSQNMGELVYLHLEKDTYRDVTTYWRWRVLPPSGVGTLSIMGVVAVRDMAYYMQYYSLPIITALLTPVIQLILCVRLIYKSPQRKSLKQR